MFKRTPQVLRQLDETDCGAACLATLTAYFGGHFRVSTLRDQIGVGPDGTTLFDVAKTAESLGLETEVFEVEPDSIESVPLPGILHLDNHFIVVFECKDETCLIGDPAEGAARRVASTELLGSTPRALLCLKSTPAFLEHAPRRQASTLKSILSLFNPYRRSLTWLLVSALAGSAILVGAIPFLSRALMDDLDARRAPTLMLAALALSSFVSLLLGHGQRILTHRLAIQVDFDLGKRLITHLLTLPLKFFASRRTGDLLSRLSDIQMLKMFAVGRGVDILVYTLLLIVFWVSMAIFDFGIALVVLATLVLYFGYIVVSTRQLLLHYERGAKVSAEAESRLIESIRGMLAIKSAQAERFAAEQWAEQYQKTLPLTIEVFKVSNRISFLSDLFFKAGPVLVIAWGATRMLNGEWTAAQLIGINTLLIAVINPIVQLSSALTEARHIAFSINRVEDLLAQVPDPHLGVKPATLSDSHPWAASLESVAFRYGGASSQIVLDELSLEIPRGSIFALVGESGSGKTSLAQIIAGLHDSEEGTVSVLGTESPGRWRTHVALVPQEPRLFKGTVLENIAWGEQTPDLKRVEHAMELSGFDRVCKSLEGGLQYSLWEDGAGLSGGQRQLLSLTRALYRNPKLLILDEPTNHMDSLAATSFLSRLKFLAQNRTVLLISHQKELIKHSDRYALLSSGRVIAQGDTQRDLGDSSSLLSRAL